MNLFFVEQHVPEYPNLEAADDDVLINKYFISNKILNGFLFDKKKLQLIYELFQNLKN
jgi:hypothetical protein